MTSEEREAFYDKHIAPEILRLGKLCQDNGLSFLAGVTWTPTDIGRTACLTADAGEAIRRANEALKGNFGVGMIAMTVTRNP